MQDIIDQGSRGPAGGTPRLRPGAAEAADLQPEGEPGQRARRHRAAGSPSAGIARHRRAILSPTAPLAGGSQGNIGGFHVNAVQAHA